VQNAANAPLAGFRVDEFWYDKGGQPVTGAKTFRHPKPLQPGETIDVTLEVPRHPAMSQNQYKFEHANGKIKPVLKPKL
jgi:acyl dehydratase